MTENIKLKPCPFCGSQAVVLKTDDSSPIYIVMCGNISCPQQPSVEADSLEGGSILWNIRPREEALEEENKRLRGALEFILEATKKENVSIAALRFVAYTALKECKDGA